MSGMCIDTTIRAARELGLTVTVLEDEYTTKDLLWDNAIIPAETVYRTFMASLSCTFAQAIKINEFLEDNQ